MKILALSFEFPKDNSDPIVSGEIKNAYNFIMELSRKGHEVKVLSIAQCKCAAIYSSEGVEVHTLKDISYRGIVRYIYRAWLVRKYINRLNQEFDVIHSHISYGSVGLLSSKLKGTPLITTPHGTNIPEIKTELTKSLKDRLRRLNAELQRLFDEFAFNNSHGIVSVSKYQLQEMQDIYNVDPERIKVIYNGVDQKLYRNKNGMRGNIRKKALFVGRACKKKGLDMIKVLAQIYEDVDFTVITGTRMFNTIGYELINDLNSLKNCTCLEAVPEKYLGDYYREADVTVVPSRGYESLPTVILESISCGTPAISVDGWGNPEVIMDKSLMFKEDDIDDIRRAFDYALTGNVEMDKAYNIKKLDEEVDVLIKYYEDLNND